MNAGLEASGSNPDVGLLHEINGMSRSTPGWFDRLVEAAGDHGLLLALIPLVLACWWSLRRRRTEPGESAAEAAAVAWAPIAAALAVAINIPIKGFVERPRPSVDHQGIVVLGQGAHGFSFVSDHATLAMAAAAALFVAHRRYGLAAIGLAAVEGLCRVYVGVNYPSDVVGGFALGAAVALLLAPGAMALLTPVMRVVGRRPWLGRLISAPAVALPGGESVSADSVPSGSLSHDSVELAETSSKNPGDLERDLAA